MNQKVFIFTNENNIMTHDKSKKKKYNNVNKKDLWNIFEEEIAGNKKIPLECIVIQENVIFVKGVNRI